MQNSVQKRQAIADQHTQRQVKSLMLDLDDIDRALINHLQDGLDLVEEPYRAIAKAFHLSQPELFERIQRLLDLGIFSRFGPMFDANKMGGKFCLCAIKVPWERYDAVTDIVNAHEQVAHNYKRDHILNMWFVIGSDREDAIEEVARKIEAESGLEVLLFPKEREFFISLKIEV
ncbi:MAG: AsnC family transcriptional regulator [Cohaesibacter sp.]|nr:AsnC family transcriptional regulator [Cohaesibacter sp.]